MVYRGLYPYRQRVRSLLFSSEFARVFETKVWCVQVAHLHNQRVHFQVRVGVFNRQQILAKISFVFFDIVVKKTNKKQTNKNKSNVV